MTEDQWDQTYELYDKIYDAVHLLVNKMTKDIDPEIDAVVRQKLTDEFRFWRYD